MLTILVYLGGMIIIGIYCSKKNENVGDFYLGGRKLGPFVTAMSAEASDMSSYLLMGLPGLAYLSGVADVGWTAIGLAIASCAASARRTCRRISPPWKTRRRPPE